VRRREFLILAGSAAMAQTRKDDAKLERVCVSTWSFHTLFPNDSAKPAKPLDLLEFPEMIADHYHVHNLEVVAPHFASTESSYFQEFQTRLKRAHSRLVNIPIDIAELWEKPSLSSPDSGVREHAISLYSKWIDRAHELGAPSVRCDPGTIDLADLAPTIASYKTLVTYARARNIDLIVENHGTAAAHPEELAAILKASGAGALPDFGNFPDAETRERGLILLFPLAKGVCHAKLNTARFDIARCVQIAKETHFQGVYSIEAGGRGDPYELVQQVLDALQTCL
jgi:sugar phosphate isomerase/epimerase